MSERPSSPTSSVDTSASGVVQIPLNDLRKLMEEVVESKLVKSNSTGSSSFRSASFDLDEVGSPGSPPPASRSLGSKTGSAASVSSDDMLDERAGESNSPRLTSHATSSSTGVAEELPAGSEIAELYDCDPRAWILAAGRLEKKRDGNWKAGWGKRFFVLTTSTLYYYLLPKRGGKGENNSLLGDERGQIRVSDIQNVRVASTSEGSLIFLDCDDIKKRGITQSSNRSIVLRAKTSDASRKWCDLLKKAREIHKQANDRIRYGGGKFLEGVIPLSAFQDFGSNSGDMPLSSSQQESLVHAAALRKSVEDKVLPLLKSSSNVVPADGGKAPHIDPSLAFAAFVCINAICYLGPSLNEFSIWMIVNFVFLSFVLYYEKLASDHDATIFRYDRAFKKLQSNCDSMGYYLRKGLSGAVEEEEEFAGPTSPISIRSPKSMEPISPTAPSPAGASAERKGPSRPIGGRTMPRAEEEEEVETSWSPCESNVFKLRDVGYKTKKQKAPSAEALYEIVGMDLLKADTKLEGVHQYVDLPPPRPEDDLELIKKSGLPRIFIINIQVPMKPPSPWGGEDPGVSVVMYFALKPETALAAAEKHDRPEVKLLSRFVHEFDKNDDIRRRFKGIGIAANFEDLGLSSRLEGLNGKPVILFKSALVQRAEDCIEVNVMVHKFGLVARTLFNQFKEKAPEVKIRGGFLIQGEDDSELPECLLGCTKIHQLDFANATHIRELLMSARGKDHPHKPTHHHPPN